MKLTAIILAAGLSTRMKAFKPLLPFDQSTVLEHSIKTFQTAGINSIQVVVGNQHNRIAEYLDTLNIPSIYNQNFHQGMFSSITTGIKSLNPDIEAFFLIPVDIPLVKPQTIKRLVTAFKRSSKNILYPSFAGTRGHPPLISTSYCQSILSWHGQGGLVNFLRQYEEDAQTIEMQDAGILLDMDTPEKYEFLKKLKTRKGVPSAEECQALLNQRYSANHPIVRHSYAVAELSAFLAQKLLSTGIEIDLELLYTAALLHDLTRQYPNHATTAGTLLKDLGYTQIGRIVTMHMDMPSSEISSISEISLLYFADKLVQEDTIVSLDERFRPKLNQHKLDHTVFTKISSRLEKAKTIQKAIEFQLGQPLSKILKEFQHDRL